MVKFEILSITPRVDIDPYGRVIKVYEIRFRTESGVEDWIEIPETEFSEAKVKELISKKVEELEKVLKTKG